ncbi:MAG: ATP-dependent DNA helicase RecG [Pelagibacterales bacterium MED-G40]|nr:MAG: ATP-dependent DNA helicase RecG [Pelagibacterales bacterium MED-G40]
MDLIKKNNFLFKNVISLKGVGKKLSNYLKNKKIEKINDLLWNFPYSYTDRSESVNLSKLEIGKIFTIKIKVIKYSFPRIRNLPNKIMCEDNFGRIDLVYFNSREGYLRKILPINEWVVVSGKIGFFKNKYQMTNPDYVTKTENLNYVKKIIPKYSLTEGINEKSYRRIIEQVLNNIQNNEDWYDDNFNKKMKFDSWKKSILKVHQDNKNRDINSNYYRRLAFDEIFAHLLTMSKNRKKIRSVIKKKKKFNNIISTKIIKKLPYQLTADQKNVINEINNDLISDKRMFRILQGDVGSGKTIVSLVAISNVIESNFQCAIMAPTEILAKQHYNFASKLFKNNNIKIDLLTGKTENKNRKKILHDLRENKTQLIIGTHALFQKKINFYNLGLIIIDEQHKFGVRQRMNLAQKGGDDCDVLLMSATPIPRTMMMSIYGDMDISKITEKPKGRKSIITLSKPEEKVQEIYSYIKDQIKNSNQVFWVCPLIEESKILNYSSAVLRYKKVKKIFKKRVGLIHGGLKKEEKEKILNDFLNKEIDILVSTTVIEVGIDFPNANLMIVENANKFGLAQLHQLRGRVGRGSKQGICILIFKKNLSSKAINRIKILKSTDNGFLIAEEDMKMRGYGDIVGFQQSGIKFFKIADPVHHEDLFKIAERKISTLSLEEENSSKFNFLIKLFDKAEIIEI